MYGEGPLSQLPPSSLKGRYLLVRVIFFPEIPAPFGIGVSISTDPRVNKLGVIFSHPYLLCSTVSNSAERAESSELLDSTSVL